MRKGPVGDIRKIGILGKGILEFSVGVRAYAARFSREWVILETTQINPSIVRGMASYCDGLITGVTNVETSQVIAAIGRPCIDAGTVRTGSQLPSVRIDDHMIGRVAARYLINKGYRHFGFATMWRGPYVQARRDGYVAELGRAGTGCNWLQLQPQADIEQIVQPLASWLSGLPLPVALLAATDSVGTFIINTCRQIGLHVPRQVAVLGVSNNVALCQTTSPPLSSVSVGMKRWGYESAAMLDRVMSEQDLPHNSLVLPPGPVVERGSTDFLVVDDDLCKSAVTHIREHACDPLTVEALAAVIGMSRRCLERRFQQSLRTSPHIEIHRVQMERAKKLLADTTLPIAQVARAAGMAPDSLLEAFKKELAMTPSQYRAKLAGSSPLTCPPSAGPS